MEVQYFNRVVFSTFQQLKSVAANFSQGANILRIQGANLSSQPAFTCSKLTIETLEEGVKYVQS